VIQELKPSFYTSREGYNWIRWPKGLPLDIDDLIKRGSICVTISGLYLHSIAFGNAHAGWNHFIRWDCINGFTDEPEEVIY